MAAELLVVGLNHLGAAVEVREAMAKKAAETGLFNAVVRDAAGLSDCVVLSTCSRFEVYAATDAAGEARLKAMLSARAGRSLDGVLYTHRGAEAARHLLRVSAGLDSWIVGETEILGQVKAAYADAAAEKTAARAEHLVFQRALYMGKKVRAETRIVDGIASIGGAAAMLARRLFADITRRKVLVFGAGTMAESTVRHLCSKGVAGVWVANRSLDKARALAADLDGGALSLEDGFAKLKEADIIVVSTGAEGYLLDAARIREAAAGRGGRPLFLIDIALPRNIDPAAAGLPEVYLYDLDDLRRMMTESLARRKKDCDRAEAMVAAEADAFWLALNAPPLPPSARPLTRALARAAAAA
ncbi:MAG: glutamyl-tRNA reductase [Elusimicrobia bacterium]|nr:glutamyl-tRNA reductase [Elusimicrobiota bacterium]